MKERTKVIPCVFTGLKSFWISSAVVSMRASHRLPNRGPYHRGPTTMGRDRGGEDGEPVDVVHAVLRGYSRSPGTWMGRWIADGRSAAWWMVFSAGTTRVWRPSGFARIRVHVEAGIVGAGDLQPETVAGREQVRRREEPDLELVRLSRRHQRLPFPGFPVAGAQDPVRDVEVEPLGVVLVRGIDVDELGREVRVGGTRRRPQGDGHGADHLDVFGQRVGLEHEDIGAVGGAAAVHPRRRRSRSRIRPAAIGRCARADRSRPA